MKLRILLSGLALMAATTLVSAQTNPNATVPKDTPAKGQAFTDNNNDGICDNAQAAGQGVCTGKKKSACKAQACPKGKDTQGKALAQESGKAGDACCKKAKCQDEGAGFVDANNDGVCDHAGKTAKK